MNQQIHNKLTMGLAKSHSDAHEQSDVCILTSEDNYIVSIGIEDKENRFAAPLEAIIRATGTNKVSYRAFCIAVPLPTPLIALLKLGVREVYFLEGIPTERVNELAKEAKIIFRSMDLKTDIVSG